MCVTWRLPASCFLCHLAAQPECCEQPPAAAQFLQTCSTTSGDPLLVTELFQSHLLAAAEPLTISYLNGLKTVHIFLSFPWDALP